MDLSATILLPRELHNIHTHDPQLKLVVFDVTDFTKDLKGLLEPLRQARTAMWKNPEHDTTIRRYELTPQFLADLYSDAHDMDVERMTGDLEFDSRQITAMALNHNAAVGSAEMSKRFIEHAVTSTVSLDDEGKKALSRLTRSQRLEAKKDYDMKIRLDNLYDFTDRFSDFAGVVGDLIRYAESAEAKANGSTPAQTEHHKNTLNTIIAEYRDALTKGKISKEQVERAVKSMLSRANLNLTGTPTKRGAPLSVDQLKARIAKRVEASKLNFLLNKKWVLNMAMPTTAIQQRLWKDSVTDSKYWNDVVIDTPAATEIATGTLQEASNWSEAGSSAWTRQAYAEPPERESSEPLVPTSMQFSRQESSESPAPPSLPLTRQGSSESLNSESLPLTRQGSSESLAPPSHPLTRQESSESLDEGYHFRH